MVCFFTWSALYDFYMILAQRVISRISSRPLVDNSKVCNIIPLSLLLITLPILLYPMNT